MSGRFLFPGKTKGRSPHSVSAENASTPRRSGARENLEHGLPFILFGVVLVALAAWMAVTHSYSGGGRLSVWVLVATIGIALGGGGLALALVDETSPPVGSAPNRDLVLVNRQEWERLKAARTTPATRPPQLPAEGPTAGASSPGAATLPPSHPIPPAVDPALVARASEELLHGSRVGPATSSGRRTALTGMDGSPDAGAAARTGSARGHRDSERAAAAPIDRPWVITAPRVPAWQEEPVPELESALAELEREASRVTHAPPKTPQEQCISCGRGVSAYSEQACVVCGHPLCDPCIELSVNDRRPSICPNCAAPHP